MVVAHCMMCSTARSPLWVPAVARRGPLCLAERWEWQFGCCPPFRTGILFLALSCYVSLNSAEFHTLPPCSATTQRQSINIIGPPCPENRRFFDRDLGRGAEGQRICFGTQLSRLLLFGQQQMRPHVTRWACPQDAGEASNHVASCNRQPGIETP